MKYQPVTTELNDPKTQVCSGSPNQGIDPRNPKRNPLETGAVSDWENRGDTGVKAAVN